MWKRSVEDNFGEGATDADEAVAFLQLLVGDGGGEILIHLSFEALLHAGGAGAAAAVVGEGRSLVQDRLYLLYLFDLLFVVDRPVEIQRELPVQPEIRAGAEHPRFGPVVEKYL